jgi:hypothetical protein
MPTLAFRPDADGFAFVNSFTFDTSERAALSGLTSVAAGVAVAAVVPGLGPVLSPIASAAAAGFVALGPLPAYGLCGGMCYAAADYWNARTPPPRGAHSADEPVRGSVGGGAVRGLLWNRLIDSLVTGGVLARTVEWMIRLNVLPGILGGGRWLKQQTEAELNALRAHIDQGQVWPVGLVGTTLSAWDQHQVLVYGYQDRGALCDLFVYDPNSPHQETGLPTTVLTVDRSLTTNAEITGSSLTAAIGKVVGLFCSNYASGAVPALAADFGEFISEPSGLVQRVWGVRFPLPNAAEVVALGGNPTTVRANVPVPDPPGRGSPRDSIMLRDRSMADVFIFAGGARFLVPPAQLATFGGASTVAVVPPAGLARFTNPPDDGTLVREVSRPEVYRIENGAKRWVTTPQHLAALGGLPTVRLVPDGSLSSLPTGPLIPPTHPNECAAIRASIAELSEDVTRLTEQIDEMEDPDNPRATATLKAQRTRLAQRIADLQARAATLGCP